MNEKKKEKKTKKTTLKLIGRYLKVNKLSLKFNFPIFSSVTFNLLAKSRKESSARI